MTFPGDYLSIWLRRQIVTLSLSQVSGYGIDHLVMQREHPAPAWLCIVHDMCYRTKQLDVAESLPEFLQENGVVANRGYRRARPTMHLRDFGAQKAAISTEDLDPAPARSRPGIA